MCLLLSREWYSYHFPELVKIVNDNYLYAKVAKHIKDRKTLSDESKEGLAEIVQDDSKAEAIIAASRMSMGRSPEQFCVEIVSQ
jgi:nucleolar protein 56